MKHLYRKIESDVWNNKPSIKISFINHKDHYDWDCSPSYFNYKTSWRQNIGASEIFNTNESYNKIKTFSIVNNFAYFAYMENKHEETL